MRYALGTLFTSLFLLALFLSVCSVYRWQNSNALASAGIETMAKVTENHESMMPDGYPSRGFHPVFSISLKFTDMAGGEHTVHYNTDIRALAETCTIGAVVRIRHLPADPRVFYIVGVVGERAYQFHSGTLVLAGAAATLLTIFTGLELRFG